MKPYWRKHLGWMVLFILLFGAVYMAIEERNLWVWYGAVYTLTVIGMGVYVIVKRKDAYIRKRTLSLMFFQFFLFFLLHRFLLPKELGKAAGYPWPLRIDALFPWRPEWVLIYAFIFVFVFLPIVTYFYGRRVYCGWICSCGAIAETLGDPFRQRAPKGRLASKLEIGMYTVLFIAAAVTILAWLGNMQGYRWYVLIIDFYIAGIFTMAVFPFMGGRIWCRYFCPSAAFIGAISKRGRFAITGDADKCLREGTCSKNCQMGIDVQAIICSGKKIKSDQCVGCGVCISLCPAKALRFEGGFRSKRET